ncbi:NADPH quinone oxidoreductase [Saccharospirillum sp. MSK14-1]|uniref:NAD(P)H-dependent oxidoreductase n=1 Tax=Saccharospirillum sp. MSK14-1 TaxID=1897632 RepID=UPI000D33BF24|nr:NAD(P)H-dependent oxidoreductase [Saccharospirillum sp. MSK14-1]PTY37766.1 NADPH quinone oxidoreductase [Saccharospirillum sp. MSK14-1]
MSALILHSHPEPTAFNAQLTQQATQTLTQMGYSADVADLYQEGFDPVERGEHYPDRTDAEVFSPLTEQRHAWQQRSLPTDVQRHVSRLEQAELLILQFPLWWHGPPAILKGWFDRVLISGGLYTSRMRYDNGYFKGRRALISVTTGAPAEALGPGGRGGDIDALLWPLHYSLHYLGYSVLPPFVAAGVQGQGYRYRDEAAFAQHLTGLKQRWSEHLRRLDAHSPLVFPGWQDWDSAGRALPLAR